MGGGGMRANCDNRVEQRRGKRCLIQDSGNWEEGFELRTVGIFEKRWPLGLHKVGLKSTVASVLRSELKPEKKTSRKCTVCVASRAVLATCPGDGGGWQLGGERSHFLLPSRWRGHLFPRSYLDRTRTGTLHRGRDAFGVFAPTWGSM